MPPFIDANVLIPYLSGHDETLLARARSIVEVDAPRVVPITVILETAWVLERSYRYRARDVAGALLDFLGRANVSVAEIPKDNVVAMFRRWHGGSIGSAGDAMIAATMVAVGAERIFSFERRFPRDLGWEVSDAPTA